MATSETAEQQLLRESARRYLEKNSGPAFTQAALRDPLGVHNTLWSSVAEMGWLGLGVGDVYGGVDSDFRTLAIVLEEMGRVCFPGPFFHSVVAGTRLITKIATHPQKLQLLPGVARGTTVLTVALQEGFSEFDSEIQTQARPVGGDFVLRGRKRMVAYADIADLTLCSARITDASGDVRPGLGIFVIPARHAAVTSQRNHEISGCISSDLTLCDLRVPADALLGGTTMPWAVLEGILLEAAVGKCAEMIGGAQRAMEIAVGHAQERRQFGKPIGSFQAIQHHCTNMLVHVETARRLADESVAVIDSGTLSNCRAAATKVWCNYAYREVVRLAHQVMGGMGYIDQHMMPWHFRHARTSESTLGDSDTLLDIVAREMYAGVAAGGADGWPALFAAA